MKIRKYQIKDLINVSKLIQKTYAEFNNGEGNKKAVQRYLDAYSTENSNLEFLEESYSSTPIFLVAIENQQLVGMIRGNKNKIFNLFVNGSQHKKGIGKKLVDLFEKEAIKQNSNEIRIKASIYATLFYQKVGYKKTTGIRNFHGLQIQPMLKKF